MLRIDSAIVRSPGSDVRTDPESKAPANEVDIFEQGRSATPDVRYQPRGHFTQADPREAAEAQAAAILARLRRAGCLADSANLTTHGPKLTALVEAGISALELSRVVGQPPQVVLKAMVADVSWLELKQEMCELGFDSPLLEQPSASTCLSFDPPEIFGLTGRTPLQGFQQQLLLRFGQLLDDDNGNGLPDAGDAVVFVDENGVTQRKDFADLDPEVVRLVEYNLATTSALRDYMAMPATAKMRFPGNGTRSVNEELWTLTTTHGGVLASTLKPGVSPAAAIDDHFHGNGALYDPECAAFLVLARLKGRLNYYRGRYGDQAGSYRFDADFGKRAHHVRRAKKYFQRYLDSKMSWAEYTSAYPPPAVEHVMQISPHNVRGDLERPLKLWKHMATGFAGGDAGYFENRSVSHSGWEAGYGGENVIFLGYVDGVSLFYGHPDGSKTEQGWKDTLGKDSLKLNHMSDYADYFSKTGMMMRALSVSDQQIDLLGDRVADLTERQPDGWQEKVDRLRSRAGWWRTVGELRAVIATELDPESTDSVRTFLDRDANIDGPLDLEPLFDGLSARGRSRAAAAFAHLGASDQDEVARQLGAETAAELSSDQKVLGALFVTLSTETGELDEELRGETIQAVRNVEFDEVSSWIENGGHLSSRERFAAWLASASFSSWYSKTHGVEYAGSQNPVDMTCRQITSIVEQVLPMTRDMCTANSTLNGRRERLSAQMAQLLKNGELGDAEFRPNFDPALPSAG